MAITTFIPKVWSARLLANLEKALVFAPLFNRDYEGEIAQYGDTVHINTLAGISVKKYTPNTDIDDPEQLTTTDQTLVIDEGNYFNFYLNDVDAAQSRSDLMDGAMRNAAYAIADKVDQYLAGKLLDAATITESADIASKSNAINAYDSVVKLKTAMDKKNAPKTGRVLVVTPEFEAAMLLDNRFVSAGVQASEDRLVNGNVFRAAGFEIHVSNNLTNACVAFSRDAATYAEQIVKTEAYRREKGFDDGVKGLHLCGAKVTRPDIVAKLTLA